MRYGVEFFAGLYPEAAPARKRFAAALENMQESLGHLNDIAIARELIDRLGLVPAAGAVALTPHPAEEEAHLAEAQAQFDLLEEAGPFWD